ncbi:uncharacterized protein DUF559 [Amnibacterium kyonggiense]|uniref:Uncharacterized protein DUF559 n=2 Tax=Amnibacterium kyonggiense TaxID=595671 RepID=A0A4R7FEJ8_9MICO|nr:uncharacterized protein DUF559 [Amnibacterium kyonggiense]
MRSRRFAQPYRGVRTSGPLATVLDRARAYAQKMRPEAFFSHVTAAVLRGIWLPLVLERSELLHVSVPPTVRAPRDRLVKGHHLVPRAGQVTLHLGLRVADEIETWCQLAQILGLEDLVVAGESLLAKNRRRPRRVWELEAAVRAGDRPRQALLNAALPLLREGVRSAMETRLRRLLVAAGLPEPLINQEIFDAAGRRVGECDLVYPVQKVVVEYEGSQHFDEQATLDDIEKYERLQDLGWRVIRVTKDDMRMRSTQTVERVRRALVQRGLAA